MKSRSFIIIFMVFLVWSCGDDDSRLAPARERVEEAINDLQQKLVAPANGWALEYQPTPESGVYFMLLDFDEEGRVRIQTDIPANDQEFYDHTISYRVDNLIGVELIFETYGAFHFLFELEQATFGAEFQFVFEREEDDNLILRSKSDPNSVSATRITLVPAQPGDENRFSREVAENLEFFKTANPQIAPSIGLPAQPPKQQIIFEDSEISLFWDMDVDKRTVTTTFIGAGLSIQEIIDNGGGFLLEQTVGFIIRDGGLEFTEPIDLGNAFMNQILLNDFTNDGPQYCSLSPDNGPRYAGSIPGFGSAQMIASLFDINGTAFQPGFAYSVNSFFIFDGDGNSLSDPGGIIAEKFPDATGFFFFYNFDSQVLPSFSTGLILEDSLGNGNFFLRGFNAIENEEGNRLDVVFNDTIYWDGIVPIAPEREDDLRELTDLLYEGGSVYAFNLPLDGLALFDLFNPCNSYEILLVQ